MTTEKEIALALQHAPDAKKAAAYMERNAKELATQQDVLGEYEEFVLQRCNAERRYEAAKVACREAYNRFRTDAAGKISVPGGPENFGLEFDREAAERAVKHFSLNGLATAWSRATIAYDEAWIALICARRDEAANRAVMQWIRRNEANASSFASESVRLAKQAEYLAEKARAS